MAQKPGSITIARHGEPALSRKVWLTPTEYGTFWQTYEEGGLLAGQSAPPHLVDPASKADVVWVSTRKRAQETARILIGERECRYDERLIEAPLPPPPFPRFIRMKPKYWGFFARTWWWWFNHHRGQETRQQATARARAVAAEISAEADAGRNVLVVAHGFFNAMLGLELMRLGWRRVWGRGWKYWSTRRFERR
jgi:broad specificity phosphatase PhoE